jgi:hypothetical protein
VQEVVLKGPVGLNEPKAGETPRVALMDTREYSSPDYVDLD